MGVCRHGERLKRLEAHRIVDIDRIGGGRAMRRAGCGGGTEDVVGNAIFIRNPAAPNLRPHIVAAARGDDGELFLSKFGTRRQLVLSGAELVERVQHFRRQQLGDDAVDRFEREPARWRDPPGRRE